MLRHCKIAVALLVVQVSLISGFHPIQQTFGQPNESVKILITDAIEDLQNNDTNTALTHSNLASQELSSQGISSSDSTLVLIHDAIQDILNNDTDTALIHLSLVNEQLEIPSDGAITSAVSLNKTSALNTTLTEKQKENATLTVGKYECTDNNLNGRCSLDEPKSAASLCTDVNQDLYCDWFKPVNVHPNGTITVNATASPPPVEINLCADNDYDGKCDIGKGKGVTPIKNKCPDNNHDNVCEWYLATDGVWYPQGDGPTIVEIQKENATSVLETRPFFDPGTAAQSDYVCYSDAYDDGRNLFYNVTESDACQSPGYADYYFGGFEDGCMARGNTDEFCIDYVNRIDTEQRMASPAESKGTTIDGLPANLPSECYIYDEAGEVFGVYSEGICAGQQTPEQTGVSNVESGNITSEEYCEDFNGDGFCDITHLSDGSTLVEDQEEIERLKEGNNGMPDTQQQQRQPSGSTSVPVQPQQIRINWGAICRNPIVDSFISEPCETLTSPDGFTLTSRGHRVLACLGVGGVATFLAPDVLASIKSLGPATGCGSNTGGEPSPLGQGNPLDNMLDGLFRK